MFYATLTNIEEIDLSGITCKIKGVPLFNNPGNKLKTIKMAWDWSDMTGDLPNYMFADFNSLENMEWGRNLKANFNVVFKGAATQAQELSDKMVQTTNQVLSDHSIDLSAGDRQRLENANQLNVAKNQLLAIENKLSPLEAQKAKIELGILETLQQEALAAVEVTKKKKVTKN